MAHRHNLLVRRRIYAHRGLIAGLLACSALTLPDAAMAQTWTGAVSDDYADGRNWSGGVAPDPDAGPVNRVVAINTTTNASVVDTGDIVNGNELRIGAFGAATLTVRGGGSLTAESIVVGGSLDGVHNGSAQGTLLISGAGTQVAAGRLAAGFNDFSTGTISVTEGALLTSTSGEVGHRNSTGTVTLSGAGSRWNILGAGNVRLGLGDGDNSRGLVEILDGAAMNLGAGSFETRPGSSLHISGANSRLDGAAGSRLTLNGTELLENGAVARVGTTEFANTATLTIRSGARLETTDVLTTTFAQDARVLVTGAGTHLTSAGNFQFVAGGVGTEIIFEDGATVTSTANVGSALAFRGSRRLIVRDGAQFNLTGGTAASFTLDGGTLEVTDASVSLGGNLIFSDSIVASMALFRNSDFSANGISLLGANSRLIVGADVGQAAAGIGTIDFGGLISISQPSASLILNYSGPGFTIGSQFSGTGGRFEHVAGDTRLTGMSNQWRGITELSGGSLAIDNLFGDGTGPTTAMNVSGDATLSGRGTIGGVVTVADGIIRPGGDPLTEAGGGEADRVSAAAALLRGDAIGTLTFSDALSLGAGSRLAFQLGAPTGIAGTDSDLINVGGNLTLDGTVDVTDAGQFGAGLYRLINYRGALTDNGLLVGTTPTGFSASDLTVQTSIANQVNLLVEVAPGMVNFWDGANIAANGIVDGGTGIWTSTGRNWTSAAGTQNGTYDPTQVLIFAGTAGTVTVDNGPGQIVVRDTNQFSPLGLQFATSGYTVVGGDIAFDGIATIRVGDGSAAGAGFNATIGSNLTGAERIDKTDLGTLSLTGTNSFSARSRVQGGTLEIAGGGSFTTNGLEVALEGPATLRVTGAGSIVDVGTGIRTGFINNFAGTIEVLNGGTLRDSAFGGHNFGAGSTVRVSGSGSLLDLGQVSLSQGTLLVENGGLANVTPFSFSPTGSLIVRSGGRIETTGGDGSWVVPNGLIQGPGSSFTSNRALSIAPAVPNNPAARFVVEDGASVTVNTNTNSGLGFAGPISTLDVRSGASFTLTGGSDAGLSVENSLLTVDNATFSIDGVLLGGQRFGNNTVILRNADFSARQVELRAATDRMVIGGDASEAATGAGRFNVGQLSLGNEATSLTINHNSTGFEIGSEFQGAGAIRHLAGDTRVTGASQFWGGTTQLTGGSVAVDGLFGSAAHRMNVSGGAILSGGGAIGGVVTVADGTIRPGGDHLATPDGGNDTRLSAAAARLGDDAIGTLTFTGSLDLGAASRLDVQLGAPTGVAGLDSDLINVGGNLTLDGTVDVTDVGGFGAGLYRLINYGGTLTDNGLLVGLTPMGFAPSDLIVQTSTAQQVNLLVGTPVSSFNFWDGANIDGNGVINGGAGTWSTTGTNWTIADGTRNGPFDTSQFLIFAGAPGNVMVDNAAGAISLANGVQFAVNGYTVSGGEILLNAEDPCGECSPEPGDVIFRVGDGTQAGAAFVATIAAPLVGEAGIAKFDLGTLILTGHNTYAGGSDVQGGTLQGTTTSLQGPINIGVAGMLRFAQDNAGTYADVLSGSGAIIKDQAGTLTLTGGSGDFTGQTRLAAGSIALSGTLGGVLTTAAGTRLIGNGTVGGLDLGGMLNPGAGPATFNVTGNLTIRAGSTYAVEVSAAGASDRIEVGGRAVIEGGTVAITTLDPDLNYNDGSIYRIINAAGGLTGAFAGLTESSAFLDFTLGYDPTGAFLATKVIAQFPDVALTYNQRQASTGLMDLDRTAGSDANVVYNAIVILAAEPAQAAFDASSGEIYPTLLTSGQRDGFALGSRIAMRGRADNRQGLALWGGFVGGTGHVDSDGNGARAETDSIGGELGIDYRGKDNGWAAGFGIGWQNGNLTLDGRNSRADTNAKHIGAYLRYGTEMTGITATATVVHSETDADVTRRINVGSINRLATSHADINTTAALGELRYGLGSDRLTFGPLVSIEVARSKLGGVAETGSGALDLNTDGGSESAARYGVGGFVRYANDGGYIDLGARYALQDLDNSGVDLIMGGSPTPFNIRAARGNRSALRIAANAEMALGKSWAISSHLGAVHAADEASLNAHVRLSLRF